MLHPLSQRVQAVVQLRRKLPEHSGTKMPLRNSAELSQGSSAALQDSQGSALQQSSGTRLPDRVRLQLQARVLPRSPRDRETRVPEGTRLCSHGTRNSAQIELPHCREAALLHEIQ